MNAFATKSFLKFASTSCNSKKNEGILSIEMDRIIGKMPYFITFSEKFPAEDFLITPICFSGPDIESTVILKCISENNLSISGGFIQTRYKTLRTNFFLETDKFIAFKDARYNYRIDLVLDNSLYIKSMKRDARQRLSKLLSLSDSKIQFSEARSQTEVSKFSLLYSETAQRVDFPLSYRFIQQDWINLLSSDKWFLYKLQYESRLIAGCVVSFHENNIFDFTFMAHDPNFVDAPRLLIYYLRNYLHSKYGFGFLDLGGGISEGDSLSSFKSRLGSEKISFERIRFMSKNFMVKNHLDSLKVKSYLQNKWPCP